MRKSKVIDIFNGVGNLAAALGLGRHAIYMWPDILKQETVDRVIGACVRHGIDYQPLLEHDDGQVIS